MRDLIKEHDTIFYDMRFYFACEGNARKTEER